MRRATHKKSRNGCRRCKARRVKSDASPRKQCDEQRPCRNCVRHGATCSLETGFPPTSPRTNDDSVEAVSNAEDPRSALLSPIRAKIAALQDLASQIGGDLEALDFGSVCRNAPACRSPRTAGNVASLQASDWMQKLQLFHHYCTCAYRSFSRDSATEDVWKTIVPQVACSHEFLMNGLLAVSALHLAHTCPDQEAQYIIISTSYQTLALQDLSAQLVDLNEANCEAYFFLASFIFVWTTRSIARPLNQTDPVTPADIAHSFWLLQGIKAILDFKPTEEWRREGPLAFLLRQREPPGQRRIGGFDAQLDKVIVLAQSLPRSPDVDNTQSSCLMAIESLKRTYDLCTADEDPGNWRQIWHWPVMLPRLFVDLIGSKHPVALIILAHFAILAHRFENRGWTLIGWSASVLAIVENALDNEWEGWIEWPKRCLQQGIDVANVSVELVL